MQLVFVALAQNQHYKTLLAPYIDDRPSQQNLDEEAAMMMKLDREYKTNPPKMMNWLSWKGEDITSGACDEENSD